MSKILEAQVDGVYDSFIDILTKANAKCHQHYLKIYDTVVCFDGYISKSIIKTIIEKRLLENDCIT